VSTLILIVSALCRTLYFAYLSDLLELLTMNTSQNWSRTGKNAETEASFTNQAEESEVEIPNNVVPR
jgi:hypothetical protein